MGLFSKLFGKREEAEIRHEEPTMTEQPPTVNEQPEPEPKPDRKREEGVRWMNKKTYELFPEEEEMLENAFKGLDIDSMTSAKEGFHFLLGGADHHGVRPYMVFAGRTIFEPDNYYDKKAIRLEHNNGELLGYILKIEQKDYKRLTGWRDQLPFIGFTYEKDGKVRGEILLFPDDPDGKYSTKEAMLTMSKKLWGRMAWIDHHGDRY